MHKSIFLVPALSLVLAGCSTAQKAAEKVTQTAQKSAAEQAIRTNCKYDKDVCEYFVSQAKLMERPVVMTTTTSSTSDKTLNGMVSTTKMDGKGNIESISTDNGKEQSRMIIFNNATYTKTPTEDTWIKMSSGDKDDSSLFNTKAMMEEMKETFSEENTELAVTKVGEEACGSLNCFVFEMVDSANKEFGKTKVWVDTKDHFPRKMEVGDAKYQTVIMYSYEPVTINEPSPVKEFEMPSIPGIENGQMPSSEELKQMMQDFKDLPQTNDGE